MNRALIDYNPETEVFEAAAPALAASAAVNLGDLDQTALAVGLLSVTNETELDRFLDRLMDRTAQAAGIRIRKSVAQELKDILRISVVNAMPQASRVPALRTVSGEQAAENGAKFVQVASRFFGLELEGLSPEDQELEIAKSFVRFAYEAAKIAAAAPPQWPAQTAAKIAAMKAAKELAPGLLRKLATTQSKSLSKITSRRSHASTLVEEINMHDIDRTQMELESEAPNFETEEFEYEEESEEEFEEEYGESMLNEAEELELASELLGVGSEAELDQFLGNVIKSLARKAGKVISSPLGKSVGRMLKGVAGKLVPIAGGALGGMVGGPLGAKIGSGLASAAGSALGLEAETLEQEDLEFEGAKQFARLAADTVQKAIDAPTSADPKAVAKTAVVSAVKKYAPGLINGAQSSAASASRQRGRSGRWLRRGNSIVLLGV